MFDEYIDLCKENIISNLLDLIRIKSVCGHTLKGMPFGEGPSKALEYVLQLGEKLGFKIKNVDGYAGHVEFGDGDKVLGILVHIDVVPEGDGWTYPPFGGQIYDGKIFGRGAIDDKGPVISILYAMKAVMDSGVTLNHKVRLIIGTNEENSWEDIEYYLKKEGSPDLAFTPDAHFPVIYAEKGIIDFELNSYLIDKKSSKLDLIQLTGGSIRDTLPDNCIAVLRNNAFDISCLKEILNKFNNEHKIKVEMYEEKQNIVLRVKGTTENYEVIGHGPNLISYMIYFLHKLRLSKGNDANKFIYEYYEKIGLNYYGFPANFLLKDRLLNNLIINIGVINLNEDTVHIEGDIRYPASADYEVIEQGIISELKDTMFIYKRDNHIPPIYMNENSTLVKTLLEVYKEHTKDFISKPIELSGCTYARAIKNAVGFGPVFPNQKELTHEIDEYIEIDHLLEITKIYAKAIYKLGKCKD